MKPAEGFLFIKKKNNDAIDYKIFTVNLNFRNMLSYSSVSAGAIVVKGDEYWDYDKQVDLESFNSKTLYDILMKQSKETTQELAKQKDEVKLKNVVAG